MKITTNILNGFIYTFIILCFMGYKIECTCNNQNGTGPRNPLTNCTFPNPKTHSFEYDYMTDFDIRSSDFTTYFSPSFSEANIQAYIFIPNNNPRQNPYDAMNNNQHAATYLVNYANNHYFNQSSTQGYLATMDRILNYPAGEIGGATIRYPDLKDPCFVFAGNAPSFQGDIWKTDCAIHEMGHQLGLETADHDDHSSDNACCIMRSPLENGCGLSNNTFCLKHKCILNGQF